MPPSASYPNWKHSLIYLSAAVCLVFLFLCRIIQRQCLSFNRAFFSRRRNPRQLLNENNDEHPSQLQSGGLATAVIHSLPAIQFREEIKECGGQGNTDCAVCLGEFFEGEWLRLLPNCAHIFHVSCIDTWFHSHSTCPLCRTNVLYDFSSCSSSVSLVALLETVRREDTYQERPLGYRLLESETMRNPEFRLGAMSGRLFESESDESPHGMVSPLGGPNNQQTIENLLRLAHNYKGESSTVGRNNQALSASPEVPH